MNSTTSFTFLATLFVLLLISASIIFRSFLIRRRFRQRVEGALAQGGYFHLPPSGLGLTSRFIGEKPRVHEAWVEQSALLEKAHWQSIMPVTVHLTRNVEPAGEFRVLDPQDTPQRRPSFLARLKRRSESTDLHPTTNNRETSADDTVSVCVLLSMPHPDSTMYFKHSPEDLAGLSKSQLFEGNQQSLGVRAGKATDEGVPNVVFGITELPVLGAWTETKEAL